MARGGQKQGLLQNARIALKPVIPRKTAAWRAADFLGNPSYIVAKTDCHASVRTGSQ